LSSVLNILAFSSLKGVECILYVVDCSRSPQQEENKIMQALQNQKTPLIMVLNKIDKSKRYLNDYIDLWKEKTHRKIDPVKYFVPVSALTGKNIPELIHSVLGLLPEGEPFYSGKGKTDFPLFYRVTDLIREKLCLLLKEELPYKTAVEVTKIDTESKVAHIYANILVSEKSHKSIVIGQKGEKIKEIGLQARKDLEILLKKKVFLKTWVRIEKDWQDKPRILRELGYTGL
jgi:GTPase